MLVLTRKEGEAIHFFEEDGKRRVLKVVAIQGNRVKLAFDYPDNTEIWRDELVKSNPPQRNDL